jgi:hypothetical protein
MLIRQKKSWHITILVLIILSLLLLTINKQKIYEERRTIIEKILSLDLGISSIENTLDDGEKFHIKASSSEKIIPLISSIPKIINYKLFHESKFDKIDIDIDFSNYLTLMKDRDKAIKNQFLYATTEVDATITYMGKVYKADLRLKGDMFDHWQSKHRMSLRVKLKNDKTILGFSAFSVQKPSTRHHPYDFTFQSLFRDTGGITSIDKFAHIFVNGENWGVMNIEEHMSKELLEKQNRKESIIVRFSTSAAEADELLYLKKSKLPYSGYRPSDPFIFLHLYNNKKSLKNEHNRKMYSYILNNRLSNNNNIYDIDSFSKALILSLVWNKMDSLANENCRYYFNPYTLKLEPITSDQSVRWEKIQDDNYLFSEYVKILSNKQFLEHFPRNLEIVKKTVPNINKYLSHYQSLFPVEKNKSTKIINDNLEKILSNKEKYFVDPIINYDVKNELKNKNTIIKTPILPTKQQASEFSKHLHIKHYTNGTLELYNLITDNVTVKAVLFDGKSFTDKEIIVPSYMSHPEPTIIKTPYKGIQDDMFTVNTEYQGFNRVSKNDITLFSDGIDNPLLLDTAHEFNFIEKLNEKTYEFKHGSWTVNKPIIIDGDVHITPGTNLRFAKNAYIIIKGSLTAIGGESNPITLKAALDSWKGVYVLNASKKSYLNNVNISNISSLEDGLLKLTGGITFYKSDVDIENVRISNVKAEDAINIIESSFLLNSVFIDNTVSDGLDSDFSKGSVLHSKLSNIGGDALDFSGSNVSIINTKASKVKDKAVSAGEKSTLNIENSQFSNIGIGVVSKDESAVNVSNTSILDYKLYAAMSYIKKDFYGSPKINVSNCSVSNDNAYIRQKGTTMIVDNIEILESEINVEKLYKLE